ncbi:BAG family molecular chaperone regulator 6 [Diospyros lotus]|uniref:BAG family molecular chaperone regulator 6 n=1 Tax=Diospyros lotus TaxID=55363 RepID=UPI0022597F78|nr:BAG family molecular chaperone regulator 6 [Diospyros lotus]
MYPGYRCMDSLPPQRNQMPHTEHCYPSSEGLPHMKTDASRSPVTYEAWPYGSNYGHSIPVGCQGCWGHGFFPAYYGFRPPYPHHPWPSPFHCHGIYPSFPDSYPLHYAPPYFPMGQPRYEYDKNMPGGYPCCECPNNPCNWREDRHPRIEEQEPDFGKKINDDNRSNNSLIPVDFKTRPFPVVWIPPGYMNNRDNREEKSPREPGLQARDEYPSDTRARENLKSSQQEPSVWRGWFPFDINRLRSLKDDEDKQSQEQQLENKNQFPFPIFWMPYKAEREERQDHKEENTDGDTEEKPSSALKVISASSPGRNDVTSQHGVTDQNVGGDVGLNTAEKKGSGEKIIFMKQPDERGGKRIGEKVTERKDREIAVKDTEGSGEKQPSEKDTKRSSSSPTKTSKLPPVCLRVDPLPNRKNGNGSSRSPSPPGHRGKSPKSPCPSAEENSQDDRQSVSRSLNKSNGVEPNERHGRVVEVVDGITMQDRNEDNKIHEQNGVPLNLPIDSCENTVMGQGASKAGIGGDVSNLKEGEEVRDTEDKKSEVAMKSEDATISCESGDLSESKEDTGARQTGKEDIEETKKEKRKSLTEAEAATTIQSAYRGFEVRRLGTLNKLKQMAKLREQVAEVRTRISALESYPDMIKDDRKRLEMGETIMSLLLKLDTIQGLHPSIRNFRKSVAKELVSLQEKLDSLTAKKSEVSPAKIMEDPPMDTGEDSSVQGEQKDAEAVHRSTDIVEGSKDNRTDSVDHWEDQGFCPKESVSGTQGVENSELMSNEGCKESNKKITEALLGSSADSGKEGRETGHKLEDALNNEGLDNGQTMMLSAQVQNLESKLPIGSSPVGTEEDVNSVVKAAVQGVSGQQLAAESSQRNEKIEAGRCEVLAGGEVESSSAIDGTTIDDEAVDGNQVQRPSEALSEEPVKAILEDESRRQGDFELHKGTMVEWKGQGETVSPINMDVHMEKSSRGNEVSLKENEPLEEELTVRAGGGGSPVDDFLDKAELKETRPELSPTENETNSADPAYKPQELHPELSLADNEIIHGGEASKQEEPLINTTSLHNELQHGREEKDDSEVGSDTDKCWEEKEVAIEELTEGGKVEPQTVTAGGENQDLAQDVRQKFEQEVPATVTGNDEVIKQSLGSEAADDEAMKIVTKPAPTGAEQNEGDVFPMSPTASQQSETGSESGRKLVEENEKLRKMMEKLIEAGKEQLTAISNLSARVNELEKKVQTKRKVRTGRVRARCLSNDPVKGRARGIAA